MAPTNQEQRWPSREEEGSAPHVLVRVDTAEYSGTLVLRKWGVACARHVLPLVTQDDYGDCKDAVDLTVAYLDGQVPAAEWMTNAYLRMNWAFLMERRKNPPRTNLAAYYATLAINAACVMLDPYKAANFALAAVVAAAQHAGRTEDPDREAEIQWQVAQLAGFLPDLHAPSANP